MTAAVVMLAVALSGAVGVIVWLVHGRVAAADQAADARVAQVATEAELERVQFQLAATQRALEASDARADALQELLDDEVVTPPLGAGLARDDVRGRVLRLAERWSTADKDRLATEPGQAVPAPPAPRSAIPELLDPEHPGV